MAIESSNTLIGNDELLTYIIIVLSIFIIPMMYLNIKNTNIFSLLLFVSLLFIFIFKNIQHSDKKDYDIKYDWYFYLRIILIIIILLHFFQYIYNVNNTIKYKKTRGGFLNNLRATVRNTFRTKNKVAPVPVVSFSDSGKYSSNSNSKSSASFITNASQGSVILEEVTDKKDEKVGFDDIDLEVTDENEELTVARLSRFVNSLIDYSIDKRIKIYNEIIKYIGDDAQYDKIDLKQTVNDENELRIGNDILLKKEIGSISKYGDIYHTTIRGYNVASKIMDDEDYNEKEIYIAKLITNNIIKHKVSRHFVIMYYDHIFTRKVIVIDENNNNKEIDKKMLLSINELANGDLKGLLTIEEVLKSEDLLFNLLFQCFISIATFHNYTGYYHSDAHSGNFLYQVNNEKGYYKYDYNGNIFYLKSCEYNIMINDFGLSEKNNSEYVNIRIKKNIADYINIIYAFINKIHINDAQKQDSSISVDKKIGCSHIFDSMINNNNLRTNASNKVGIGKKIKDYMLTRFNRMRNNNNLQTNVSKQNAYKPVGISKGFTKKMLSIIKILEAIEKEAKYPIDIVDKIFKKIFLKFGDNIIIRQTFQYSTIINNKAFKITPTPVMLEPYGGARPPTRGNREAIGGARPQ